MPSAPESCDAWQGLLLLYQDGELDEPRRTELNGHLERCESCKSALVELVEFEESFEAYRGDLDDPVPSFDVRSRYVFRSRYVAPAKTVHLRRRFLFAAAALLVAAGIGYGLWWARRTPAQGIEQLAVRWHGLRSVDEPGFTLELRLARPLYVHVFLLREPERPGTAVRVDPLFPAGGADGNARFLGHSGNRFETGKVVIPHPRIDSEFPFTDGYLVVGATPRDLSGELATITDMLMEIVRASSARGQSLEETSAAASRALKTRFDQVLVEGIEP